MSPNPHVQPRRAELAEWYVNLLRPKIAAAAQAGAIPLAGLTALDQLIEPLLPPGNRAPARLSQRRFAA